MEEVKDVWSSAYFLETRIVLLNKRGRHGYSDRTSFPIELHRFQSTQQLCL